MSKRNLYLYLISSLLILILLVQARSYIIAKRIEVSGEQIIVKFTSQERKPKTTNFYFTYYIDGKKIVTANSGVNFSILNSKEQNELIKNLKLSSFYYADFSKEHPNSIKVNIRKTVTDTVAILNAGFSLNDIK